MQLDKIKFLSNASDIMIVEEGYGGSSKYKFKKNGKKYFLKIGKFKLIDNLEEILNECHINHSKIIECGIYDNQNNYIILEFLNGTNLKHALNNYDKKFIYEFGFHMGEQYRNIKDKYGIKEVSEDERSNFFNDCHERIKDLKSTLTKQQNYINKEEKELIEFFIKYLENNFNLFENSISVFNHTDIKPSNFIIKDKVIYAVDIENTGYKEIAYALEWSYARSDYNNEKNWSFARGYLDGLFNLNVPQNVLKSCNYVYAFNKVKYLKDLLEKQKYEELNKFMHFFKDNLLKENDIIIDEKLNSPFNIEKLCLEGFDISLVKGSYNGYNLTFKCCKNKQNYFLKVMNISEKTYKKTLLNYKIIEDSKIPTSKIITSGVLLEDKCYYILFEFIDLKEMNYDRKYIKYEDSYRLGKLVAQHLIRLKGKKYDNISVIDKNDLYTRINDILDKLFQYPNYSDVISHSKEEIKERIDFYIESFNDEPIDLIHADVKFGNILYDDSEKIYFIDNESLIYSYDIINFFHNIHERFRTNNMTESYRGFLNGYLKFMNNGKIPERIEGQIKLLLIFHIIIYSLDYLKKKCSKEKIDEFFPIYDDYVFNGKSIDWLEKC